jgi:hypothetical protein
MNLTNYTAVNTARYPIEEEYQTQDGILLAEWRAGCMTVFSGFRGESAQPFELELSKAESIEIQEIGHLNIGNVKGAKRTFQHMISAAGIVYKQDEQHYYSPMTDPEIDGLLKLLVEA